MDNFNNSIWKWNIKVALLMTIGVTTLNVAYCAVGGWLFQRPQTIFTAFTGSSQAIKSVFLPKIRERERASKENGTKSNLGNCVCIKWIQWSSKIPFLTRHTKLDSGRLKIISWIKINSIGIVSACWVGIGMVTQINATRVGEGRHKK